MHQIWVLSLLHSSEEGTACGCPDYMSCFLMQVNKVTEGMQDAAENVKEGIKDVGDKIAGAAKKVTGQD